LRRAWLRSLGWQNEGQPATYDRHQVLDELADHVEAALDMKRIGSLVGQPIG
jgi:cobyric acid synthase